ncbi:dynein intermediate chain 3, ciliary-like [Pollicipes pollicipes]|uniref:dynein intermediate chain 3, ciliary-like n=1 Tax=Pollicipes pollicipes TaxID=41117 RepID=UPI001884EAE8|nr:dynein intermediate chain 3, ciliary-like [Pollicipes pollicipes]
MDFQYVYIKKRSEFGRQCFFNSEPAAITCDIAPNAELAAKFLHVNPVHRGTQVGCEMSEHEVSTDRAEYATTGVDHTEGGWPKDINPQDVEQTTRFKKKVEKDDVYMSSVLQLGSMMEHCIKQNNTLDIYEEYFGGEGGDAPGDDTTSAKTINVFRDPCPVHRAVSSLSWSPDASHLAAAYTSLRFQSSAQDLPTQSFVWDVENPSRPDYTMAPPDCLVSVEFNPKESFVLAGGTYRGRVCWFDRRRGPQPVEMSTLEASHRDPVYSTVWVNSKSGTELFTASTDGMVLWWDTRKLSEPTETLIIDVNKTQEPSLRLAQGATVLEYETTIPTKFMIGTEQGCVIQCNRKGKTQTEKIAAIYSAHLGAVKQVQRNPAFLKNFLTIGDWCAKIWSEECRESAIFWTDNGEVRLTNGAWSPSRPSVFFTTKADGTVDVWDILYQQRLPVLTVQVGDSQLETLRVQEAGSILAAGSADGQITLLELSDSLVSSQKNDRLVLTAMFERETRREKILEGKNREARLLKKMKADSANSAVSERPSTISPTLTASARAEKEQIEVELIEEAQKSFFGTVYKVGPCGCRWTLALQEKAARQECQQRQMSEKGVEAQLDSVDFQAPDLSADSPGPQDAAGANLASSAARQGSVGSVAAKSSSTAAAKASSTMAAKASSTMAAKTSSTMAAKTSSTMAAKTSSTMAAKLSSTVAAKISSVMAAKTSSTATARKSSTMAARTSSTAAATASSTEATQASSATGASSATDQIADVVDGLEAAVDDLLDPSREETEATSPEDTADQTTDS